DKIVTGHYARVRFNEESGRYELLKGLDDTKDQSYVLYSLTQEQLAHTDFPLGDYPKTKVREIAEANGFINARKHDSQDICFVPDGHYDRFIEDYVGHELPKGNFVDVDGNVLGTHKGIIHYTIGQRKGLGIAAKEPLYVKEIRPETNEVVLSNHEAIFSDTLLAGDFNWVSIPEPTKSIRVMAKARYKHVAQPATATVKGDKVEVVFDEKQRAITKGQAVVLYDGDVVLGGGTIL
ncbi:MAG: tRNA 2-thiouridine(34) synthase MnmA, partial [Lachnospiraceae bacterium]|nr:tRNA 2-thiouridine(34) synthase MnmA [Lachnospiraceae bacterium]